MSWQTYFASPAHQEEKSDLPLLAALGERYSHHKPFRSQKVVFGHLLVRNSLVVAETLLAGGAELVISEGFSSPVVPPVIAELAFHGIPVLAIPEAVQAGDLFFDVDAILGRCRTPLGAAEATRTGVRHYAQIPCPVVSADDCRAKRIEGFFGTGEGFLRAWQRFFPGEQIAGKRLVQFGYGKIGRGVAHRTRAAGLDVTVVEAGAEALGKARQEGFHALHSQPDGELQRALAQADIVISVTGVPGILSRSLPPGWLRANRPVLVNQGAEDEYGPAFAEDEILGGREVPLNFHLERPTPNRYVDPALAAHVLALEALVGGDYPVGVHPLPEHMDEWLVTEWRRCWPLEDLTGIGRELGLG
jgi:adenosylhomocysteinase